jgi:hypothetical protein
VPDVNTPDPADDDLAALMEWYEWHTAKYGEEPQPAEGPVIDDLVPNPRYL